MLQLHADPIDAIPNVGENQVIVFTEWPGRSPKDVEDQITYPLSVDLLTVPHAESVRGKSMFGYVDLKHRFPGLRTDDWIALDEGTWFYMPTLYPAASFSQGMEVLQTQGDVDQGDSRGRKRPGQDWPRRIGPRPGTRA
jgi:hypothetical protein